ncbi:MAG TPA: flagellar basal body L-ring protein FlgH [Verrucomicrobiae bacterium]|jgi:flagellar L-ring protein precursor FlgH
MTRLFSSLYDSTVIACLVITLQVGNLVADSLWLDGNASRSMFADKKARAVGDILTVLIQENNGATRQNNTTTSKKASVNAAIASILYGPSVSGLLTKKGTLPALNVNSDTEFNGGGQINNQETITAQMAVRVIDVLPNGNMVIEGRLHTAFSGEKQDAILRGVVRYDDIAANNTLFSYNIADAAIQFISKGTITDNQKKGWFMKVWDKVSPF